MALRVHGNVIDIPQCMCDLQDHITSLPQEVLATPFGQMIAPMLGGMQQQLGSVGQPPLGAPTASTPSIPTGPASGLHLLNCTGLEQISSCSWSPHESLCSEPHQD